MTLIWQNNVDDENNNMNESQNQSNDSSSIKKKPKVVDADTENNVDDENKPKKLAPFTKIWSSKQEVKLLKCAIKFKRDKGLEPKESFDEFHELALRSLKTDFSRMQVSEKLRRLKEKYDKNIKKGHNANSFSDSHDEAVFCLSEKIWRRDFATAPPPVEIDKVRLFVSHLSGLVSSDYAKYIGPNPDLQVEEALINNDLQLVENRRVGQRLKGRMKDVLIQELSMLIAKMDLLQEVAKDRLEALRSSLK